MKKENKGEQKGEVAKTFKVKKKKQGKGKRNKVVKF